MAGNILGNLRVRLTAETEDFRRGLSSAQKNVQTFEKSLSKFRNSTMANVVSLGAIGYALKSSIDVANRYDNAQRQLGATAKLTGIELGTLEGISKNAQAAFKLSSISANAFTIELTKLASKAGDVGKASAGLSAFLDIGAARGLSADQTLKAVQQSILGIDEGTDKLFSKNPSVLYAEFAKQIGTTAGKLTDAQKAQSILNAAMQDGEKVRGEYGKWLTSSAGQQYLLTQSVEQTQAVLGKALQPALVAMIPALTTMVGWIGKSIGVVQQFGASLAILPPLLKMVGSATAFDPKGFAAAKDEFIRMRDAAREMVAEIRSGKNVASSGAPILPSITPAPQAAHAEGKKVGAAYFDGLREEYENLRYEIAQKFLQLGGSENDRLALEEDHQLRLLEIERQRLVAKQRAGELTWTELQDQTKIIDAQRELAKVTRAQMSAANEALEKKQGELAHIADLRGALLDLLPDSKGGKGANVGSAAASVLGDKLKLGGMLGGLMGSALLPGVGGLIGGAIGSLFGGKDKEKETPVVSTLSAIERAQRDTIAAIQTQTDKLLNPESRLLNLPATFTVPQYNPGGLGGGPTTYGGDTNVSVNINLTKADLNPKQVAEATMNAITDALYEARRNSPNTMGTGGRSGRIIGVRRGRI